MAAKAKAKAKTKTKTPAKRASPQAPPAKRRDKAAPVDPSVKAKDIQAALRELANPNIAGPSQQFFKTGEGEYGAGDQFLGIRVPNLRQVAKRFREAPFAAMKTVLRSKYHEERLCALFLMVQRFQRGSAEQQKEVFDHYLASTKYVNNWDLVDGSAHQIVGGYLLERDRRRLRRLAKSKDLWERRISIIATYHFIKHEQFEDTLELAALLRDDSEDLIHKAVGWMLREVGNRNRAAEEGFLQEHYRHMPRTMLRYAIEKFPEARRKQYLHGKI